MQLGFFAKINEMRIGIDNLKSEKTNVTMMYGFKKDVIVLSGKAFKHFVLTHNSSFNEKSNRRRNSMNYLKPRQIRSNVKRSNNL